MFPWNKIWNISGYQTGEKTLHMKNPVPLSAQTQLCIAEVYFIYFHRQHFSSLKIFSYSVVAAFDITAGATKVDWWTLKTHIVQPPQMLSSLRPCDFYGMQEACSISLWKAWNVWQLSIRTKVCTLKFYAKVVTGCNRRGACDESYIAWPQLWHIYHLHQETKSSTRHWLCISWKYAMCHREDHDLELP